jgi:hypothetical protein
MSLIGVECWCDNYFFGKLLRNDKLIKKEKNKNAVLVGLKKAQDRVAIGIIDHDYDENLPLKILNDFEVIFNSEFTSVYKNLNYFQFVFILKPYALEKWLLRYLEIQNISISNFGYSNPKEFIIDSKNCNSSMTSNFKLLIAHILDNYLNTANHIHLIKRQLDYILENKFNFDKTDFTNV